MARIYFDSNVYSNLRNKKEEKYKLLNDTISKFKSNLIFVYSHAHIRDKISDLTEHKFDDFKFMKELVVDNYLSYHGVEKNTDFYLATPLEVFEDNDSLDSVDSVMNFMSRPYKEIRSLIEKERDNISYPVGERSYVLKELFSEGKLGEKFVDFIKDSLYHKDKNNIPYYDFYLHSYSILDILGFSKDKLNSKNSYNNLFNDSLHSYYARYCDYLVTEDEGLRKKSRILYDEYKCSTEILSVDEFLKNIEIIGSATERNISDFIKKIASDLYFGTVLSKNEEEESVVSVLRASQKYFNFFDILSILKTKDEGYFVFITKSESHYLSAPNFRECEMITNRLTEILGDDFRNTSFFDFEKEVEEIKSKKWEGRYWDLGDTNVILQNKNQFCIQIGPLTQWPHLSKFDLKEKN